MIALPSLAGSIASLAALRLPWKAIGLGAAVLAVAGGLWLHGRHTAARVAEAEAEAARLARVEAAQNALLIGYQDALREVEAEAAAAAARAEDLAGRSRRIETTIGACLDEDIPEDVIRALGGAAAGAGSSGVGSSGAGPGGAAAAAGLR